MLKIKDSVDLKELEKYGFEEDIPFYEKEVGFEYLKIVYYVSKRNRQFQVATYDGYDIDLDDTLYDLIKDGLVEKVEG